MQKFVHVVTCTSWIWDVHFFKLDRENCFSSPPCIPLSTKSEFSLYNWTGFGAMATITCYINSNHKRQDAHNSIRVAPDLQFVLLLKIAGIGTQSGIF